MTKTIVVGVGNPILGDDGVGIHIVNTIRQQINNQNATLEIAYTGGMNLLDIIRGYDKVILVDAVHHEGRKTGEVQRYFLSELPTVHSSNPHDVSLPEAIRFAQQLGETNLPKKIIVIGVIVQSSLDFGEQLSSEVAAAVPTAAQMILSELKNN
jgi:hydrogenase maturation protease